MNEKTYKFQIAKSATEIETIEVTEDELTKEQKDLMLGDMFHQFLDLPDELQHRLALKIYMYNADIESQEAIN